MMIKSALLPMLAGLAWLASASPVAAELDFTLNHKPMVTDAIDVDNPYITDNGSKIFLQLPNLWKTFASAPGIEFIPNAPSAKVRLEAVKRDKPLTIDQAGGRELLAQLTNQMPEGAKDVVADPVEIDPMPIYGWHDMEAIASYEAFGQKMRKSIMHVQMLPNRTIELSVVATEADFSRVHKEARHILSSWFEPSRDLPPDLQRKDEFTEKQAR